MTPSKVAAAALASFALVAIAAIVVKELRNAPAAEPQRETGRKIVVTYFHGTVGCAACDRIEAYAKEAVAQAFDDEVKQGRVVWREIDYDRRGYEHFVAHYGLLTRSVVVSQLNDGIERRWKNLDRVWELLDDKKAFQLYVQDEVAGYLVIR